MPQLETDLHSLQLEESLCSKEDPAQLQTKKKKKVESQGAKFSIYVESIYVDVWLIYNFVLFQEYSIIN